MASTTSSSSPTSKPHVVMLPVPLNGHVIPMMQLAHHFVSAGIFVTFVHYARPVCFSMRNLILSHLELANTQHNLRIVILPEHLKDELVAGDKHAAPNHFELSDAGTAVNTLTAEFPPFVRKLNQSPEPAHCILADTNYLWAQDLANELGIPRADFQTSTATYYKTVSSLPSLISHGYIRHSLGQIEAPNEVLQDHRNLMITGIPDVPPLRIKDLPTFLLEEGNDAILMRDCALRSHHRGKEAKWVLFNTCYELESKEIDALRKDKVNLYPVGPLFSSLKKTTEHECLRWLDTQSTSSVLLLAFGSTGAHSASQIRSLAMALEASQQPFLWVTGADTMVDNQPILAALPEALVGRLRQKGLMLPWIPQTSVLSHPSVGGFLTHCGWNSVLESLSAGVPMLAWPVSFDQPLVRWQVVYNWKVGIDIRSGNSEGEVCAEDIEKAIRELLGKQGIELRRRADELRNILKLATDAGGSANFHLKKLIDELKHLYAN